ncbi:acetyl-CoA decarbonylase/synthase complex subunit alpha [Candidatus Methanoplasma termitum]|uniref:Carbon monoxide dehydrogenase n=1 Tax=Candidatus Methanoplasma termitum TaxID=1577791 RepID=A0A0A7LD30_9ARCH|nr:anaerobic carbon-monoxide dehydrogenase catalytic subunit [Candidatus Methanoplasma termitum]AIZ56197.1 acetyl-CoA decarbonylase/synthase complex subunit alpha [Candidatus Methanoplasma termitum]
MTKWSNQKICKSADKPLENFIVNLPQNTAFHRVDTQNMKCEFGLRGICCKLCANGPCRITQDAPKGVCGATADVIAARNFLRAIAAGSGCYIHIVENAALNLRSIALAKGELRGKKALNSLCVKFGIKGKNDHEKALKVADAVLNDLYKPDYEKMVLTEKMAYAPRVKRWKEIGIMPGGAKAEVFSGVVKTSTNLNSDPVHMLFHTLRLGISTGLYGLTLTNLLNDVVIGEPELRMAPVGLNVIDPDYINIMITGHQHSRFSYIQDRLIQDDVVKKAKAAGAKGFKIVGCTCVGQDMQLRGAHCTKIFNGHAGNNFTSEPILATGAIDAVISEFNCTLPGIEPICDELKIKQICVDAVAKKANAELKEFTYETREKAVNEIIDEVIAAYKARRKVVPMKLLPDHGNKNSLTGVSEVSLKAFLGDSWKPLIDLIAAGKIKGLAGVVGCSNLQCGGHDVLTVELTKQLIAKDILVLTAGCSSGGIENCGLMMPEAAELAGPNLKAVCKQLGIPPVLNFGPCLAIGRLEIVATEVAEALGVDLPQLPLVLSAAQWLEEQALADGAFGLALGLPLHLGIPPFVTGSDLIVKVLTEDMKTLTGGYVFINDDAVETADMFEKIILQKRKDLGLP